MKEVCGRNMASSYPCIHCFKNLFSAASDLSSKPVVALLMPGTAEAAETGVVGVGAEPGVDDQLTVRQLRLVHTFWRNTITTT